MTHRYQRLHELASSLVEAFAGGQDIASHVDELDIELNRLERESEAATNVLTTGRDDYEHRGLDGKPTGLVLDRVVAAEFIPGNAPHCPVCHRTCLGDVHPECAKEVAT